MILSKWYKNVKGIYEEISNIKINGLKFICFMKIKH